MEHCSSLAPLPHTSSMSCHATAAEVLIHLETLHTTTPRKGKAGDWCPVERGWDGSLPPPNCCFQGTSRSGDGKVSGWSRQQNFGAWGVWIQQPFPEANRTGGKGEETDEKSRAWLQQGWVQLEMHPRRAGRRLLACRALRCR